MNIKIAFDMDGVIADCLDKKLEIYNQTFNKSLSKFDLYGKKLEMIIPKDQACYIHQRMADKDFFKDLKVMQGSQCVLEELSNKFEIFITTAAMEFPSSFNAKYNWLKANFPFIPDSNIVFCGDKSILNTNYLIDDQSQHFKCFCGEGIIFTAPHNIYERGYKRVNNWNEVKQFFLNNM